MGRFFNLETLATALLLFAAGLAGSRAFHLGWLAASGVGVGTMMLLLLPVGAMVQDQLLPFYVSRGWIDRALKLAIEIRDTAATRKLKDIASIDVALIHLARADFEHALSNLKGIQLAHLPPKTRAVVRGHTGYCLGHLDRDLEAAEEAADEAVKAVPEEGAFAYFAGLVKLKRKKTDEALKLLQSSLQKDSDPEVPLPGERHYFLAKALEAAGDRAGARQALEVAAKTKGRFGDQARIEAGPTAPQETA